MSDVTKARDLPESKIRAALIDMGWTPPWQPIETAPKDGTLIEVFSPGRYGLEFIVCPCAYDPEFGFYIGELRVPTHWRPIVRPRLIRRPAA